MKSDILLGLALMCLAPPFGADSLVAPIRRQTICQAQLYITKVVVVEPISVNTFVTQNTSFAVNNYLTLTVDNAPTNLNFVTTGTTTRSVTQTQYNSRWVSTYTSSLQG